MAKLALRRDRLDHHRQQAGIHSEAELARRMRIDTGQLSRVLLGKSQPGPQLIIGLIQVFGINSLVDLLHLRYDNHNSDTWGAA